MYFRKAAFQTAMMAITLIAPTLAHAYEYRISNNDKIIFKNAYARTRREQCGAAISDTARAEEKVITKVIKWVCYQDGYASGGFPDLAGFIEKNPHWPSQKILRNKAEFALSGNEPADEIIQYFTDFPPVTGHGMRILADAKMKNGKSKEEVTSLLQQSWQQGDFSHDEEDSFLRQHGNVLTEEDHYKRVDRMLWEGDEDGAKHLYNLLSSNHKLLVKVRLKLMHNNSGAITALPQNLQDEPSIIYEQARILSEREDFDRVYELLLPITTIMPYQPKWWKLKSRLVRELLNQNQIKEAFEIAKNHGNLVGSSEYPDAEWLAGWIELRYLGRPGDGYKHFFNMYNNVSYPVSLSRAAYWAGRAAEANRNPDIAENWFKIAASYPTTFYGQLAFTKQNGKKAHLILPKSPEMGILPSNAGKIRELLMSAYILESVGQSILSEKFIKAAVEAVDTPEEMAYIGEFGMKIGRPNLAVVAAKEALTKNVVLVTHGWPITKYMPKSIGVEKPLALSIIRQESVFNPGALSGAKAMGLMQLIPATAKRVAKSLSMRYNASSLLSNPGYNITLGSEYLGSLVNDFDGSYILAIASYNAGPGNARKWAKKYNDPRQMDNIEDVLDWMESIPFGETRNYVQRVLENIQVYRAEIGSNNLTIEDDLLRGAKK